MIFILILDNLYCDFYSESAQIWSEQNRTAQNCSESDRGVQSTDISGTWIKKYSPISSKNRKAVKIQKHINAHIHWLHTLNSLDKFKLTDQHEICHHFHCIHLDRHCLWISNAIERPRQWQTWTLRYVKQSYSSRSTCWMRCDKRSVPVS